MVEFLLPVAAWRDSDVRIKVEEYRFMALRFQAVFQLDRNRVVFAAMADEYFTQLAHLLQNFLPHNEI